MFRRAYRSWLDRLLAAVEIVALGGWIGALCGFAFVGAPAAFRILTDVGQFAALTNANLTLLGTTGEVCGGIAIAAALVRARDAADRTVDIVRALLVLVAVGLVVYHALAIVPAILAVPDVRSAEFHALHARSSAVYGGIVLLALAALVMAAIRDDA